MYSSNRIAKEFISNETIINIGDFIEYVDNNTITMIEFGSFIVANITGTENDSDENGSNGISPKPVILVDRGNTHGMLRSVLRRTDIACCSLLPKNENVINRDASVNITKRKLRALNKNYNSIK